MLYTRMLRNTKLALRARTQVREQSEPVPVVLAFLAYLLRAPIPAEEGRPHLTDGLMFPHLFREEPEESLKEEAMYAIDRACSYDDKDGLNDMNIRLRDINRSLAFNRPLLASAIKIYLNRLPSKLLEKIDSRLVASLFSDMKPPYVVSFFSGNIHSNIEPLQVQNDSTENHVSDGISRGSRSFRVEMVASLFSRRCEQI